MTPSADPRLQLAPPGGQAGFWLFALAFVLPVESVVGLESQLERFKQEVREQYF